MKEHTLGGSEQEAWLEAGLFYVWALLQLQNPLLMKLVESEVPRFANGFRLVVEKRPLAERFPSDMGQRFGGILPRGRQRPVASNILDAAGQKHPRCGGCENVLC